MRWKHSKGARHDHDSAEFCTPNHNHPIVIISSIHPIVLDVLDTFADIILAEDQREILNDGHQTETQMPEDFHDMIHGHQLPAPYKQRRI